ncbi:MAG TPA: TetR/AcrR family transcriptional regulator [Chitinophagaceae bacterium]|jgi:TetR/AcrR family transcriptional repressor of nem operon
MAGRPKIFDEQAVIDKATEVFWLKGYEASSADELLEAMGIGKGSFYLAFKGGKKELYERSLEQFSQKAMEKLRKDLAATGDPLELVRDFFLSIADSKKANHEKGCYMVNAINEMGAVDSRLQAKAIQLLQVLEKVFTDVIREAQKNKQLLTKEKPELIARSLITLWSGINITRRMYPDARQLKQLIALQLDVLK